MNKSILVTGATGTVGSRLASSLARASGARVRAFIRNPSKAAHLANLGVELHSGTFEDGDSLAAALRDIDTVALITMPGARAAEQAQVTIEHARRAGVRKIVRLSAIKASLDGPTDNTRQHGRTELALRESGLVHVSLRPQFFMQNVLSGAESIAKQGKLYSGVGAARIGMIDARDVADAMDRAIQSSDFDGQALELTGPESITHQEVAAALARAIDRPVTYVAVSPEAVGEMVRGFGADDWTVALMRDYMHAYSDGFGDFVTDAVERMIGRPPRTISAFASDVFANLAPATTPA